MVCLQATLCLCNIASNGDECCRQLYKHNVLVDVIPVLHLSDAEIVHMALCLVEMILHACPEASFFSLFRWFWLYLSYRCSAWIMRAAAWQISRFSICCFVLSGTLIIWTTTAPFTFCLMVLLFQTYVYSGLGHIHNKEHLWITEAGQIFIWYVNGKLVKLSLLETRVTDLWIFKINHLRNGH